MGSFIAVEFSLVIIDKLLSISNYFRSQVSQYIINTNVSFYRV